MRVVFWLCSVMLASCIVATAQVLPTRPGTGLKGEYYDGRNFGRLAFTRTDQNINFNWTFAASAPGQPPTRFIAPGPGLKGEDFSIRWTGHLYAPVTGLYTFRATTDDGMRVWLGGKRILNSWHNQPATQYTMTLRLEAGRYYPIRVEYYQVEYDTRASLAWKLPNSTEDFQPIPTSRLYPALPPSAKPLPPVVSATAKPAAGTISIVPGAPSTMPATATPVKPSAGTTVAGKLPDGIGLQATYYASSVRGPAVHSRVEPVVNVTWRGSTPAPSVPGQGFSVRWTGYIYAPESGLYVLHTEWDDATDITFAGESVLSMEKYEPEYFKPSKPPIPVDMVQNLTAGHFYQIDLAYKNVQGVSRAVLSWVRPSAMGRPATLEQAFEATKQYVPTVVPKQFLYPELPRPLPEPPATPVITARQLPKPVTSTKRPAARPASSLAIRPTARPTVPAKLPADTVVLPNLGALGRGATVTLPNLYFTQSTASLLPTSRPMLNALARRLREQPVLRLEIAGHTDNVGDPSLNLRLSEQRARVVRQYLVQQGIDSVRLTARGYGGSRPVADNRDPQQRPRNRRVEVVVQ